MVDFEPPYFIKETFAVVVNNVGVDGVSVGVDGVGVDGVGVDGAFGVDGVFGGGDVFGGGCVFGGGDFDGDIRWVRVYQGIVSGEELPGLALGKHPHLKQPFYEWNSDNVR